MRSLPNLITHAHLDGMSAWLVCVNEYPVIVTVCKMFLYEKLLIGGLELI